MALSMSCFTPYFFANDDVFALMISKGVGLALKPDEHLYFQNVLLGLLLKKLYTVLPQVRWYPWFEVGVLFLALWSFLAGLLLKPWTRFTLVWFTLYFLFVGLFFLTQLDFSMLACLAFQGGLFLWAGFWENPHKAFWGKAAVLGLLCFLLSALFRWHSFFFSFLLAIPLVAGVLWRERQNVKLRLAIGVVAAMVLLAGLFDHLYYQADPAWKAYLPFHPAMGYALNYQAWDYNAASKPVFDSVGWDLNDFKLFTRWYFLDPDTYSPGRLQTISDYFGTVKGFSFGNLLHLFSTATSQYLYTLQNAVLCFAVFLLFCPPPKLRAVLGNLLWVLLSVALLACFAKASERIVLPAFAFLAGLALYSAVAPGKAVPGRKKGGWTFREKTGLALLGLLVVLAVPHLARYFAVDSHFKERERLLSEVVSALHPQDDQLYVVWNSRFPYEKISAFDSFEEFRTFHILSLASFQRMPLAQAMLDRFGVKNPLREMVENPRLLMVSSDEEGELSRQYLKEKFGLETRREEVFFSPFFNVDRIRSMRPQRNKK